MDLVMALIGESGPLVSDARVWLVVEMGCWRLVLKSGGLVVLWEWWWSSLVVQRLSHA